VQGFLSAAKPPSCNVGAGSSWNPTTGSPGQLDLVQVLTDRDPGSDLAMESNTAVVDGIRMRWEERGTGSPVVLLHGIPTSTALWRHVAPKLTGRVLAWEMVGYGQSIVQGRGRDISVARQAEYLLAWLDAVGIDRPVLVGHDLGGGVAQIAATHRPEGFAGLLLTNAISYDSWPIPSVKAMRALAPVARHTPDALFRGVLATLMARGHDDRDIARESLDIHAAPYLEHGGAEAMVRQVQALDVQDTLAVADRLPDLDLAARIVWGEADQFQKLEYGERLARDLRAPLRCIPGGKHFTPEDHPDVIAEEIGALLDGLPDRSEEGS
jgi:pimeloyl-ACP methyl ester carboxylesterase